MLELADQFPAGAVAIPESVALIFILILFLLLLFRPVVKVHSRELNSFNFLLQQLHGISIRSFFLLALAWFVPRGFDSKSTQIAILAAGVALWATVETGNYLSFRYFKLPAWKILRHLPIRPTDDNGWSSSWTYVKEFFPWGKCRYFFIVGFWFCLSLHLAALSRPVGDLTAAVVAVVALIAFLRWWTKPRLKLSRAESAFIGLDQTPSQSRLKQAQRLVQLLPGSADAVTPKNIILIINESAGANAVSSQDSRKLLSEALVELAGDAKHWVVFQDALTASTCTDISIPCLMTGCAPQQSAERLHHLPTLFDVAKATGLKTLLVTSCTMQWANFDQFFLLDTIDEVLGPLEKKYPLINELNCDDILVVEDLCERLRQTVDPVCVVIYLNSLHIPFQSDSKIEIPPDLTARRQRATYIAEQSHKMIFAALRDSGRYDSSLILSVGDHGEATQAAEEAIGNLSRLTNLGAGVISPLFLMRLPGSVPPDQRDTLASNAQRLTSLIDIVPTVARFLGVHLGSESTSDGFDLFEPVPSSRIHYTLNVNDWRSWPRPAVAIAYERFRVCIDYQNFEHCCVDVHGAPFEHQDVARKDELLLRTLAEPLVQKAISRVFADKLAGYA